METFLIGLALVALSALVIFAFVVQPRLNWP
jgi:uncharacterized membrane protein YqjE